MRKFQTYWRLMQTLMFKPNQKEYYILEYFTVYFNERQK